MSGSGVRRWWHSRVVRPLWWWFGAALVCSLLGGNGALVTAGLGIALAVCCQRWRATSPAARPLLRLGRSLLGLWPQWRQRRAARPGGEAGPRGGAGRVYDPGALVSAVVAVLAAEGITTDGRWAVRPCMALLLGQGVNPVPNAPAPAAWAVAAGLAPRAQERAVRVVPVGMFTTCVFVILDTSNVLPVPLAAKAFMAGCARILTDLGVTPGSEPGPAAEWPVMTALITAATNNNGGDR